MTRPKRFSANHVLAMLHWRAMDRCDGCCRKDWRRSAGANDTRLGAGSAHVHGHCFWRHRHESSTILPELWLHTAEPTGTPASVGRLESFFVVPLRGRFQKVW